MPLQRSRRLPELKRPPRVCRQKKRNHPGSRRTLPLGLQESTCDREKSFTQRICAAVKGSKTCRRRQGASLSSHATIAAPTTFPAARRSHALAARQSRWSASFPPVARGSRRRGKRWPWRSLYRPPIRQPAGSRIVPGTECCRHRAVSGGLARALEKSKNGSTAFQANCVLRDCRRRRRHGRPRIHPLDRQQMHPKQR